MKNKMKLTYEQLQERCIKQRRELKRLNKKIELVNLLNQDKYSDLRSLSWASMNALGKYVWQLRLLLNLTASEISTEDVLGRTVKELTKFKAEDS